MSTDDCYYFLNTNTCTKGSNCPFRHCAALLNTKGTIPICSGWQAGVCGDPKCQLRHSNYETTNASFSSFGSPLPPPAETPCYFDSNGGQCKKVNCPYKHTKHATSNPIKVTKPAPKVITKPLVKSAVQVAAKTSGRPAVKAVSQTIKTNKAPVASPIPKKGKTEVASDFTIKSFETIMMEKKMKQQAPPSTVAAPITVTESIITLPVMANNSTPLSTTTSLSPAMTSSVSSPMMTIAPPLNNTVKTAAATNQHTSAIGTSKTDEQTITKQTIKYTYDEINIDRELEELDDLIKSAE